MCFAYSDSSGCSVSPTIGVRLRAINWASVQQVFWVDYLSSTCSGSGLVCSSLYPHETIPDVSIQEHYDCLGWQQVSKMTCGYGWVNTCQVDINNSLGVNTVVHAATIEVATKQM